MSSNLVSKLKWLGHDTFLIEGDKTIYIDPFQIESGPKADIIFITHDHFDHCSVEDIAKIQQDSTVFVTEKDSASKLTGDCRVVKPGDTLEVEGVQVQVVPSYNMDKDFHPKDNGWVGFILTIDGERVYHTGDADFIPEMKDIETDIALIPVSGTYVMNSSQAVEAALAIKPKLAIPMHYGAIVGSEEDAVAFKNALEGKIEVMILQKS